jgi:hypothetical protein
MAASASSKTAARASSISAVSDRQLAQQKSAAGWLPPRSNS